jgi:MFS family permease
MAVLSACGVFPLAVAGVLGGGFVERSRKRKLMLAMDIVRAGVVLLIPLAAWLGVLELWLLAAVSIVAGAATALFQNAHVAILPGLVGRDNVVEGNARLQATDSLSEVAGPAIAGLLIDLLTAPITIVVDALTYVWSATWLRKIPEIEPPAQNPSRSRWRALTADLGVGWRSVMGIPAVRAVLIAQILLYLSIGSWNALYLLLSMRVLGLSATEVGFVVSAGGIGGLAGALVAGRLVASIGIGPALAASFGLIHVGLAMLVAATLGERWTLPLLVGQQLVGDAGLVAFLILSRSLTQTCVPASEIARANGLFQAANGLVVPGASLIAGVMAEIIGIRASAIAGIVVGFLGLAPLLLPSVLRLRPSRTM